MNQHSARPLEPAYPNREHRRRNPEQGQPVGRSRWALAVMIIANLVPMGMVLWADWNVVDVVLLFWLENVIVGVFNVMKLASCQPLSIAVWFLRVMLLPFFVVHYGMFTLGHGFFLVQLLDGGVASPGFSPEFIPWTIERYQLAWPGLMLALSHGVYFVKDYLIAGGYREENPGVLMFKPYGRVVVLHIGIFLMAFAVMAMAQPLYGLMALIVLKTATEVVILLRVPGRVGSGMQQRLKVFSRLTRRWQAAHGERIARRSVASKAQGGANDRK